MEIAAAVMSAIAIVFSGMALRQTKPQSDAATRALKILQARGEPAQDQARPARKRVVGRD